MPNNRTRDWSSLSNDEELRHVNERSKSTRHQNQNPAVSWHCGPGREAVNEWDDVEQHESGDWRLVKEQLHRIHLKLLAVRCDPHGVEGGSEDAGECEEDTEGRGGLDRRVRNWQRVVVRHHSDTSTCWNKCVDGVAWEGGLVEDEVHERNGWGEHDARDLVEGDRGEGEGEIREDDVHGHGDGEWDDLLDRDAAWDEHGEARAGEGEEGEPCDEEVEGCKGELGKLERWVGEDGFVCEDLGGPSQS